MDRIKKEFFYVNDTNGDIISIGYAKESQLEKVLSILKRNDGINNNNIYYTILNRADDGDNHLVSLLSEESFLELTSLLIKREFSGTIDQKNINKQIEVFGQEEMLNISMEEPAELIQAISKCRRYGTYEYIWKLAEEIADTMIILEVLKNIYVIPDNMIEYWIAFKQNRSGIVADELLRKEEK